jgi:sugar lactone lactonase YvrE
MAYDQSAGAGAVYRLDPDGSVHVVMEQVTVSNGLDWSPDGSRAYYNDTATFTIWLFDYDPSTGLTNRRAFAELPDGGRPDGLTVDADGGIWTAVSNGGAVYRYTPDGVLADKLPVPAQKVTACAFGGERLDQLYITTSQENIDIREDRLAGSLFVADTGTRGLPVRPYAG